jgi:hypothetical protein
VKIDEQVRPRWVLVDGIPHNVTEFAGMEPKRRPSAICPLCQTPVIPKLGNERVHHYAHQPEIICSATQPETALHLNAKYYLFSQLQQTHSITIESYCSGGCGATREITWSQNWDDVIVEHTLGSYRPDVTLFINQKPIGALEILVSHKVSEEKASFFQENEIPGLEIKVDEQFYEGDFKWTPDNPLPYYRLFPNAETWFCDDCLEIRKTLQEQSKLQERRFQPKSQGRQLQHEQNNSVRTIEAKLSDIYYLSGKRYREMFFLMEQLIDGKRVKVWVKTEKETIAVEKSPITDKSLEDLRQAVAQRLDRHRKNGAIVDNYVDWQPWVAGKKYVARDTDRHPFRYKWDAEQKKWVKLFDKKPKLGQSTLPKYEGPKPPRADNQDLFPKKVETPYIWQPQIATCRYCGTSTDDWVEYDGKTKQCKCRNCNDKMKEQDNR